ncbi:hypothetical protein CAPTEDRAFT_185644 [Capitella teleta]|uniref:Uncharacterized protein n=1 Tax=Capitella teleta TaxID=283909 RepID=R7UB41_CAPTE|nr:hypothetical protein CAPTEDRAFT_185644 [Capitella teleta]|eukprot:ELU03580.1 hypothetical protein CAPTEDRAFT_185644 [Capitella teleta]
MKSAASECIPRQRKKALAGWSEVITPYRNKSIFWNKIWVENGMPEVGLIRDIRQSTKKDYKHAAKWVIGNQDNITADRMATKLYSDMNREFWDEVKRVRGNAKDCAGVIDDAVGEDAICDVFASKYEELIYSSVSFNADDMVELRRDVDIDIRSKCCEELCYSNHAVTVQDMKEALGKLKLSKSDADTDLSSDHFKRACPEFLGFLDDYKEVQRLLSAIVSNYQPPYQLDGFYQFVFDNADFKVATISGHNTFHSMGGIGCVTPYSGRSRHTIKRSTKLVKSDVTGEFGKVAIQADKKPIVSALSCIKVSSLFPDELNPRSQKLSFALDQLWMASMTLPDANLGAPSLSWDSCNLPPKGRTTKGPESKSFPP